ncbi:uncharacterized protein Z520_01462 [Fonsecaea multimorphosa CBS 102226]|uniref:PAN-3 domain-containing protein n=1 Tax=Fonsecaea multimorphosa CBS 102226 TaxID=1442371 RepID=A0A0D2HM97_9EURO|nr:uncharacterized protein Z520_01462 [Fonsecaea multimorphosa CBS 102226]KIY02996.1 hypothetical protein Z520_01462 [Fonsecaea multimorphosa CBS 102226]
MPPFILVGDINRGLYNFFGINKLHYASHDGFDDYYGIGNIYNHYFDCAFYIHYRSVHCHDYQQFKQLQQLQQFRQCIVHTLVPGSSELRGSGHTSNWSTSQPLPLATGAYNYQKVALADNPNVVYEVECWMNSGSTSSSVTSIQNVYSLESCMDLCTSYGTSACLVAYWASPNLCQLYNVVNTGGQPSVAGGQSPAKLIGQGVRTARLLTGQPQPNVVDATYLLAPGYDLGLCNNNNYQLAFIGVYYNGSSGQGPPTINTGRDNVWYVSCGASFYNSQSGTQLVPTYSVSTPVFGFTSPPATADDCARVCQAYHTVHLVNSSAPDCNLWQFVPSAVASNKCQLFPYLYGIANNQVPGTTTDANGLPITAAAILRGNSGIEFSNQAHYKKRSLPAAMDYHRRHPRDSLIDDGSIPDVIIKYDKGTGSWAEVM